MFRCRKRIGATTTAAHTNREYEDSASAGDPVDVAQLEQRTRLGLGQRAESQQDGRAIAIVVLLHDEKLVVLVLVRRRDVRHFFVHFRLVDVHTARQFQLLLDDLVDG